MGMAASQARYLGLTARKTNVEYEGQQVNQQRTALANESANTFNELLAMEVPTAPSTSDFTTIQYSYTDGVNSETITSLETITGDPEHNALVTHYHDAIVYTGVEYKKANPQVTFDSATGTYRVGNKTLTQLSSVTDPAAVSQYQAEMEQIVTDNPNAAIASSYPGSVASATDIYFWTYNSENYYVCKSDLDNCIASSKTTENQSKLNNYAAKGISKRVEHTDKAFVEYDSNGRAKSIMYDDSSAEYAISTNTVTDENAYQDAMNKYNYDMQKYEKKIADINAKTEKIQQEDRTLELRLRQLDTEQSALQQEMESVKKVIDKNVENIFKTFQS